MRCGHSLRQLSVHKFISNNERGVLAMARGAAYQLYANLAQNRERTDGQEVSKSCCCRSRNASKARSQNLTGRARKQTR